MPASTINYIYSILRKIILSQEQRHYPYRLSSAVRQNNKVCWAVHVDMQPLEFCNSQTSTLNCSGKKYLSKQLNICSVKL